MVTGLRIVFFGTPAFAVPSLDALLGATPHTVVGVVTQPDRPRGRGQRVSDSPVKARALTAALPVLQPDIIKDPAFLPRLAAWNADLGVVAAYGKILTDAVLATPRLGMVNVHASLLPKYRGAAPVHRAVIDGEPLTGVTIMRVVKALDAGPMLAQETIAIGPDATSEAVERDLARVGANLLTAIVDQIASGQAVAVEQDAAMATYAQRISRADGAVDWNWPASRVHNLIRGLHPWPHAFTYVHGKRLILIASTIAEHTLDASVGAGTVIEAAGDRLIVATGNGAIALTYIQAEGKRPMGTREFLAGHALAAGDAFSPVP